MKINRLQLTAFGHFTNFHLDFTSPTPGLHVVFGPNEAGKSTALRAIRALLYGIHSQTSDNFKHEYKKLLIGGTLQNLDGRELTFWRRKRNVGDLLDADQQVMEQRVLDEFLHGIDDPLFCSLFGINHESLISGGKDILEQQGDVGQALFSAGVGLASLHEIISGLEQEGANLFKAGGSKPELNQAIKRHRELKSEINKLSLAGTEWKSRRRSLDDVTTQLDQARRQSQELRAQLAGLSRLHRALPYLSKRDALLETRTGLHDVARLPANFSERTRQALDQNATAAQVRREALARREHVERNMAECVVRQEILDQAESIDALHKQLGMLHQAHQDRPDLHGDLLRCRAEAETLLAQAAPALDVTQVDEIKTLVGNSQTIHSLGNRFAGLEAALSQAQDLHVTASRTLKEVELALAGLPDVPDLSSLSAAVKLAQKAGDLDAQLRRLEADALALNQAAAGELQRIGLWNDASDSPEHLANLARLALPSMETIETFLDRFREQEDRRRDNKAQQAGVHDEQERVGRDIAIIEQTGQVVTEDDLTRRRAHRDQGWRLIRRVWLEGEQPGEEVRAYAQDRDLPTAFEAGMQEADRSADHLRSAAERVHQYVSLRTEAQKLGDRRLRLEQEAAALNQEQTDLHTQWLELWSPLGIAPRTPKEMRTWTERCLECRRNVLEAHKCLAEKEPIRAHRQELQSRLLGELRRVNGGPRDMGDMGDVGEELTPLLTMAEERLTTLKVLQDQAKSLQKDRGRLTRERDQAAKTLNQRQTAMDQWQVRWAEALAGFGLSAQTTPVAAAGILEALSACLTKINEADQCRSRIANIDSAIQRFEAAARSLTQSVAATELEGLPMEQAVVKLQAMLQESRTQKMRRDGFQADLERLNTDMLQAQLNLERTEEQLGELRLLAEAGSVEELREKQQRFEHWLVVQAELERLEQTLLEIGEGVALEDLDRQRREGDPDALPGQIAALREQLEGEQEPLINALSERKGELRSELQRMDGSDLAAQKEGEAQSVLAGMRRLADRYIRVRLAALLLKREIERYRQEHQGPILAAASRYFSDLTLNGYSGLRSDLDDKGRPVLVGVSDQDGLKTVEEMSSGTRDQLYLALRLATLEWRLQSHEPMPFIADDILVNFDDQRTRSTLRCLADLGKRNQVILFTHHGWVVDTVHQLNTPDHVRIHPLEPLPGYVPIR